MIDFSKNPLFLAPLAGYSDLPLRSVVKKFGCDVTVSEMISANALAFGDKKTQGMLQKSPDESPFIVQIMGNDVEVIKKAVLIINEMDWVDGIDLNCGCPAPKIVRQNSGSALLKDLNLLSKIIEIIKKTSTKRYASLKMRLGFDNKNAINVVECLNDLGLDFITIHGRTKAGGYSANVDYDAIARCADLAKMPVVANGDITSQNAKSVLSKTGAKALMIGRASIGNPWVFYEIKTGKSVDEETKKRIILCHFDENIRYYGEHGVVIFRKHLHKYSKGYDLASSFRDEINHTDGVDEMREKIEEFF
ncbi:MAG: tRNA-dihydrouridine synthase [Campylobacter sp.]|nr:tRNA-dihydrouridine synthase [Campylobacter sp.]